MARRRGLRSSKASSSYSLSGARSTAATPNPNPNPNPKTNPHPNPHPNPSPSPSPNPNQVYCSHACERRFLEFSSGIPFAHWQRAVDDLNVDLKRAIEA